MENYENNTPVNQTPVTNYNNAPVGETPVTMGEWLVSLLVMMIPCVNIIMMFVWAFGQGKESKKNFFKAYLIMMAISYALAIVLAIVFAGVFANVANSMYY